MDVKYGGSAIQMQIYIIKVPILEQRSASIIFFLINKSFLHQRSASANVNLVDPEFMKEEEKKKAFKGVFSYIMHKNIRNITQT